MKSLYPISLLLLTSFSTSAYAQLPDGGLILDLNADKGVAVEDGDRVVKWTNQMAASPAKDFVKQDEGRRRPGSGRPTWKRDVEAIGGHSTVVFQRQELVNHHEDAFDHLLTGSGHTWFAVLCVHQQIRQLKDVNSFFGNLRNGGNYEGIWGNVTDDNRVWIGSRNGITFGRWDNNNPMVVAPEPLQENRYYVVAGRMGAGTGKVQIELFINAAEPVAVKPIPVNPKANSSKLAIGQERDAVNHPGRESFDGEIARFLIYERSLTAKEMEQTLEHLKIAYSIPSE
jgi:Concanavalin A-like lectin/glucanases superfamily